MPTTTSPSLKLACGLHHPAEAATFAHRANNWQNLWDPNLSDEGFKGFLRPRNADGSWAAPDLQVRGTWPDFFYEGDLWTYSFYAPQDMRRLIQLVGGNKTFVQRLDNIFYRQHFDVTNEPGFLLPVLYDYAGRPDHTADAISQELEKAFTEQRSGIPGNDDSGAMSSWFIFNSLGFYPNAGQDIYLIGTPSFPEADIHLASGKTLRILAKDLDPQHLNHYIQSAAINGVPLNQSWFRHSQIANGGTLILTMGPAPVSGGPPILHPHCQTLFHHFAATPRRVNLSNLTRLPARRSLPSFLTALSSSIKFRSSARTIAITPASLPAKQNCGS